MGCKSAALIGSSLLFMECLVTSGAQEWNGESPNFVTRAIVTMVDALD